MRMKTDLLPNIQNATRGKFRGCLCPTGRRSGERAQMLRSAMQPCRCTPAALALPACVFMACGREMLVVSG